MSITAIKSIPLDMRKKLSDPNIPLGINKRIFNEMKSQDAKRGYKKVQVLPTDPEWRFVWRYFHQDKPNRYGIKKVYCVYESRQQQAFELNLSSIEKEAMDFQPTWSQDPWASQRTRVIERWKQSANIFSPFSTMEADGNIRIWKNVKILPLWYGTSAEMCDSISELGFIDRKKLPHVASTKNTEESFFGDTIYFTNSARYASDIDSAGHILLAWVSMKEPFPIVGDHSQIDDMKAVKEAYNAHYIPVTSINPSNPYETKYYPTKENEIAHCDEFVVFHKSQTLPRFWVKLEVELPFAPSDTPQTVNELISRLMKFLQNPNVDRDKKLRKYICIKLGILLTLEGDDYLEERHKTMYEQLRQIIDSQGNVNGQESCALVEVSQTTVISPISQSPNSSVSPYMPHQPVASEIQSNSIQSKPEKTHRKWAFWKKNRDGGSNKTDFISSKSGVIASVKTKHSSIPSIAFGKACWEKYFGDIGAEPPLPGNIKEILNESCSFWPNKKVKKTHLLVLIPNTVNGKPFTVNYLGELIQRPKSGYSTKYEYYSSYPKEAVGDKSYLSHWVLMTKDIIPGSRRASYSECCKLIANHSEKTGVPYELPHELDATTCILMHYVKTGERLYSDKPPTFTYSQDVAKDGAPLVVGGFESCGIAVCYSAAGNGAGVCRVISGCYH